MRTAVIRTRWAGLLISLCAATAAAQEAANARPRDLLAHGTGDAFWVARVASDPANPKHEQTVVQARGVGGGDQWRVLKQVEGRAVGMANRNDQLVLVTATGGWMLLWSDGMSNGEPLPRGGSVLAMAADGDDLWAVGVLPGGIEALATRPATASAALAPPAMTTAPSARAVLLRYDKGKWIGRAEVPPALRVGDAASVSLAVYDHAPVVAARRAEGTREIALLRFTGERWEELGAVKAAEGADFKWVGGDRMLLWAAAPHDSGELWGGGGTWGSGVPLKLPDKVNGGLDQRTVAAAVGRIRLLYLSAGAEQKIYEQKYDWSGAAVEGPAQLPAAPRVSGAMTVEHWVRVVLTLVLMGVMLATAWRRPSFQEALRSNRRMALPPLWMRFAAGLIDLSPVLLTALVLGMRQVPPGAVVTQGLDAAGLWALGIAVAVYVLHTTIVEAAAGRTVGKMVLRLRVVNLKGEPAGRGALVLRNIFRLVDLPVLLLVLIFMVLSPLQQRVGDLAAGTLVVMDRKAEEPEEVAAVGAGAAAGERDDNEESE
jgi:uncharacterized RDD family membrane protein YckC